MPIRWLIVAALVVGAGGLVWMNGQAVPVRPFGRAPLNQVMAAPLLVGIFIGWSVRARLAARAARAAAKRAATTSSSTD